MTSIAPIAGVAPLGAMPATTPAPAAPAQPTSLHAVLAGGANLGGGTADSWSIPALPEAPTAVAGLNGGAAPPPAPAVTGGGDQAAQGAAVASQQQIVAALEQVIVAVNQLIAALQARGVTGGGPSGGGTVGQCGMPGCTMDHGVGQASAGASGAPEAAPAADARRGADARTEPAHPARNGTDPGTVRDKTSTSGLTAEARRGLEEAHRFGLPLVSGKRSGGGGSDHDHGDAIDVGTLPIGAASSTEGTPQMKAFAEHMRREGKAGRSDVKYVILDGRIAGPTSDPRTDWEWRPYSYPGKSTAELEALKRSNRGEYNRLQHFDHVHVSFT